MKYNGDFDDIESGFETDGTTQKSHVTTRKGQRDVVVHNRKRLQQTALEKL